MNREIITEVKLQQEKGVASVRSKRADAKGMQDNKERTGR